MRVPPYSDGWHFAKRRGLHGKHAGIELQEQLTDEDFDDQHYEQPDPSTTKKGSAKAASK